MNPSIASAESSFLLWSLGIVIYALAAHTGFAAVRLGRRMDNLRSRTALAVTAGMAWGTALSIGFVLGLAGMALAFGVGFHAGFGIALWLGGALAASLLAAVLITWPGKLVHVGAGVLLGALAVGVQTGWLWAAGLRPGLKWVPEVLALAGVVMALGLAIAISSAFSEPANSSRLRWRWRLAAAGLVALAWLAGQEMMLAGLSVSNQTGSVYQQQLPAALLALVGGALVPIVLLVLALDLRYRRRQRRRRHRDQASGMSSTSLQELDSIPSSTHNRRRKVRIRGL